MKTKRRLQIPKKHRSPRALAELNELLFPNSPITVEHDFTVVGKDREYHWHVYVEGQWIDKEESLAGVAMRIYEVIDSQGGDWGSVSLRIDREWSGWSQIPPFTLAAMQILSDELRDQNAAFYKDE